MVLDTARPRYKENTTWHGMRGRDAVRKSTAQGEYFTAIHDRFLRDPVYRESQLAVGWSSEKIQRTLVSYFEQNRQKWTYEASI